MHPRARDPVRLGQGQQVVIGRAAGVHRAGFKEDSDLMKRSRIVPVRPPVHGHLPFARSVEREDQTHRRRLARSIGTEEARDHAGLHGKAEVIDGRLLPLALRQIVGIGHFALLSLAGSQSVTTS